ncbi:hypothetical protein L7F22_033613 [Adiantum nelumboides]|nr:hypothetical protein [Adiantum nelumboides]
MGMRSYGDEEFYTSEESSMEVMCLVFQQPQAKGSSMSMKVEVTAQEEPILEEQFRNMLAKDLTKKEEEDYINMFKKYPHLFITDFSMIKGVDVIQHHIDLKPDAKSVAQKLRRLGVVQQEALLSEVNKLLSGGDRALHCQRVEEGLQRLYQYCGQLNPDKCHVAEKEVVLLGHVSSQEGIKVDPFRVQAILDLPPPNSARQVITFVQRRFWDPYPPLCLLTRKESTIYVHAFGAVLMQKDPKTAYMRPIYFTSKVMTQGQKGYIDIEQLVFSLIVAIRKFRSYLLPKPFIILTLEHNLPYAIQHMSISSKISKWVLELQEYKYTFIVEDSTRASLADVLTYKVKEKKIIPKAQVKLDLSPQGELEDAYTLLFDGAYCRQRNKAAGEFVILNEEKKEVLKKGIQLHLPHSNNEAEYATLKAGLEECKSMGIKRLMVKGDALLIVRQVQGTWSCKNSKLLQWLHELKLLMKDFEAIQIQHISRQHNKEADNMANTQFEVMVGTSSSKNLFFKDKRPWRISYVVTSNIEKLDHIISMIAKSTMKDPPNVYTSFRVEGQVPCASNIDQEGKNIEFFVLSIGNAVSASGASEDTKIIIERSEPPQENGDASMDASDDASYAGGILGAGAGGYVRHDDGMVSWSWEDGGDAGGDARGDAGYVRNNDGMVSHPWEDPGNILFESKPALILDTNGDFLTSVDKRHLGAYTEVMESFFGSKKTSSSDYMEEEGEEKEDSSSSSDEEVQRNMPPSTMMQIPATSKKQSRKSGKPKESKFFLNQRLFYLVLVSLYLIQEIQAL